MVNVGQHPYTCHCMSIFISFLKVSFTHVAKCTISQPWAVLFYISKVK